MLKNELKKRALSIVKIPDDYQPVIEEYVEEKNGGGEAMFIWADEEQDEGISINLDLAGNLTRLSIDRNDKNSIMVPINVRERRESAEQFLLSHYPDALKDFAFYKTEKLTHAYRFHYKQIVMDLPLEHAGCYIDIDPAGNIIKFTYDGVKHAPEIPEMLVSKEKLKEDVMNRLYFDLTITNLYTGIHHVEEDGPRLVYEPEPFMEYKADVLKPTLTIIHDEDDPVNYVSLPPLSKEIRKDLSNEDIIGITEQMEIIREVDMGEERGIVWRDRDWEKQEKETDLSINGFFKRHSEDTVKAFISKKTGKVRGFMWFNERGGDLGLNREACYQKAIAFLHMTIPDYYQNLQLIAQENEEEDDSAQLESFVFHMHHGHGIAVQLELIVVAVNRQTGQIDHYSGPSFDIEQLSQIPVEPVISKKEASDIFINQLDFELAWKKNYDSESEPYILVYQACDRDSRTSIRYIDAMTGAVISNIDK